MLAHLRLHPQSIDDMMTMRASSVLPPLPSYSAAMSEEEDDYKALMLAEIGPLVPLPSEDEAIQALMMLADDDDKEIQSQATLLPEDELQTMVGDETQMPVCTCPPTPPCPDDKKRKNRPPPQPSREEDGFEKPSPRPSKRAKAEKPTPRSTTMHKKMATRLLKRHHRAPEPSGRERQTIIRCKCKKVPRDSPLCSLHQRSRYRWWMREQCNGEIPTAGSGDGVVVPTTRTQSNMTVLNYIRWRSRVWMPSRFYVEQA